MQRHSKIKKPSRTLSSTRIRFFVVGMLVVAGLVTYRLFTLTFTRHESYAQIARVQQSAPAVLLAGRGNIYAFDYSTGTRELLATNEKTDKGIQRAYPKDQFASHVLGFVGFEGAQRVGQYGVESYYNNILNGLARTQRPHFFGGNDKEGEDIVLTIDPTIQSYAEAKLDALLKKWSSHHGTIIVQEPSTGAILAMASSPSFDPNTYQSYAYDIYINPASQELFEPGSSFKAVTMAAAINAGVVTPNTTYDDTGQVTIGTYTIKNFNEKANGIQTMRQVLEHSLNTGTIFAERKLGDDAFLNYVVSFGFGEKTGVDLAAEVSGNIRNLYEGRAINFATASFGQGVAVTPLQLVNAYSAIANGGRLMRPYVVKEVVHANGTTTPTKPEIIDAPITEKTATTMKSLLVGVVDSGFDKARVKGYDIAGKTGTAQIPDEKGGYLENKQFIHNFVGFAPAYDPRFTILIKMDRPQGITFAADSLSPVFGDMAEFLLRYFKIPPTRL